MSDKEKPQKVLLKKGEAISANLPKLTGNMLKNVSMQRRETLEQEALEGKYFTPELQNSSLVKGGKTDLGNVMSGIKKSANFSGDMGGTGAGWRGAGGTVRQVPEVYSPLWLNSNLNLPRDRATINAWCRSFFALNPIVHNAISLHSTYPISKLNIKCKDPEVNKFFQEMIDEIDLMNVCVQIAQEYWNLGEAFVYAELDETKGKWGRLLIQNPDYITVQRSVIAGEPIISLRPDENLKRIVNGNKPSDIQQREQIDRSIIEHVKRGENIPLSNFYVSHLARKISPYEIRGTGLPVSVFRQLMLFDKLRESKFAQADSMINPLTLIKIGGGADNYKPTPEDLQLWRQVFEEAYADKNFKIFTHDSVAVEPVGFGGGIYDTSNDITQLIKEIYIGLFVPSVIMDGGGDVTYANGGISLDVLRQRYMTFRNMLSSWLRRKIFAPISKIQGFYEIKDGKKVLIVPEVEWNHMSMFDMGDYIGQLTQLIGAEPRKVSLHTLYKSLGLEYEDEMRKIREENIDSVIQAKEMEVLQKLNLTELRSLEDVSEIKEVNEPPLPGESPFGLPGGPEESGGEGGGLPGGPPGGGLGGPPPGPPGGLGGP